MLQNLQIPDNTSIKWQANHYGFQPILSNEIKLIISRQQIDKPKLISYLHDAQKFISAHVILTYISHMKFETFPTWNKLKIDIKANGEIVINRDQRASLFEYWKQKINLH